MNTRNIIKSLLILCLALGLVHTTPAKPAYAGTLTVTTLDDENDGSTCPGSDCSLREAISLANTGDIINFAVTGTITLTLGELTPGNITILGPGAGSLTIDGNNASRVFNIIGSTSISISGVTITQGRVVDEDGGGILNNGNLTLDNVILSNNHAVKNAVIFVDGGGVYNNMTGILTIKNSQILNNTANFTGGGISSLGSLSIDNVIISGNTVFGDGAGGNGGGISFGNNPSATTSINNTTISLNSAKNGGGLYTTNFNTVDISKSLFTNNEAVFSGGAIILDGTNTQYNLTNVTISGNSVTDASSAGGGIFTGGGVGMTVTLNHVTVVNNTVTGSSGGGGIFEMGSATIFLKNSILTDNISNATADEDCVGPISSQDYNIIGDADGSCVVSGTTTNNQTGVTGVTTSLADNGGPTQTHAILSSSVATDAIPNGINGCGTTIIVDQRGAGRPADGDGDTIDACDIGSFEKSSNIPTTATFGDVPTSHPYFADIEILYANGFTGGCSSSPLLFCPETTMDRAQGAVFMLRGLVGTSYVPPVEPFANPFGDSWAPGPWAQRWAQGMLDEGLTAGCSTSPLLYCPFEQMPRAQAAVFGMRLLNGSAYLPPAGTGTVFADVNSSDWYAGWAEQAYANGLLPACGMQGGMPLFCPNDLVSRGLGAYMIVRARNLSMP